MKKYLFIALGAFVAVAPMSATIASAGEKKIPTVQNLIKHNFGNKLALQTKQNEKFARKAIGDSTYYGPTEAFIMIGIN